MLTLRRRKRRTAVFSFKHHQSRPSGKGQGEQPYSYSNVINLDPQADRKTNRYILIESSSISTFGRRERRKAPVWVKHHQSRPSREGKGEQSNYDCNISNHEPRAEGNANSRFLIKTTSISTLGRWERRTAVFWFIHQVQPSCRGKGEQMVSDWNMINLDPQAKREKKTVVFGYKHHQSWPADWGKSKQLYSD